MEVTTLRTPIEEASGVGEARRCAVALAESTHLSDELTGRLALIVTEAATNLVKHAQRGEVLLAASDDDGAPAVDVVALDRGPGIADMPQALRDGFSRAGSPGGGLGAIARLASRFEIYSQPGRGTALYARVATRAAAGGRQLIAAGINIPHPSETVCGDCWGTARDPSGLAILVADGLGHGPLAQRAAIEADRAFRSHNAAPGERLTRIHEALRPTRGAAVAVAAIDPARGVVCFAGLGNIAGTIVTDGATRSVVSHHGTAGHDVRRIQEFTYPWQPGASLVLNSDGLMSHWSLNGYPGLIDKHPLLTAAVLYRDHCRGRDDVTVVVAREVE